MKDIVFDAVVYVGNETDVEFAIAQSEILKENNKPEIVKRMFRYCQCNKRSTILHTRSEGKYTGCPQKATISNSN